MEFSRKNKNKIPKWSNNSTPGYISKETKNINLKTYLHLSVYSSVIYNSQNMEANSVSINKWMDKEAGRYIYISISHIYIYNIYIIYIYNPRVYSMHIYHNTYIPPIYSMHIYHYICIYIYIYIFQLEKELKFGIYNIYTLDDVMLNEIN